MIDERWDAFVIYVNAYYAVQEAYDSARRNWEKPADGLVAFCRDGNPFLWDAQGSAEEELYKGFSNSFRTRFEDGLCTGEDGYSFAREWLAGLEGDVYGTELVASFDSITNERDFAKACSPVARQLHTRATRVELTPQDTPLPMEAPITNQPSKADIEAVIALLAKGDEEYAASLRARLSEEGE
ncbi:MAG: hypothetical protein IKF78_14520 [Atopobiaceae bacterium]|nr:hypothetical protein [Atopobiaceae bacterium]